jgi:hypothetical protein
VVMTISGDMSMKVPRKSSITLMSRSTMIGFSETACMKTTIAAGTCR